MISRKLKLNFSDVPFHWARVHEFSTDLNASSPIASQTEPYLNTIMATVRKTLPEGTLKREVDIFIKQEATHFALHNKFNDEMYSRGYESVRQIELDLRKDFQAMLKSKSLAFNSAYCAGFENLALFLCKFIFYKAQDHFVGGEQRMVDLFLWHYAEEFEHRTVAHDVFAHVSGNYFRRIYGAAYAFIHLAKYKAKIKKALFAVDRLAMSPSERAQSVQREKELNAALAKYVLPRMLAVFVPFYDPKKTMVPAAVQATLDRFEEQTA